MLVRGPNGKEFDFRLNNRNDSVQLGQLALALLQIRTTVPHGVVCFFASYSYMDSVLEKLEASGQLEELRSRTAVFHEPRHSKDLEKLLNRYAEQVTRRSEEHTSELQSLMRNSYAVFCLKKKN